MNVSLNWLRDHVDFDAYSTQELDDLLTFAGIEVEGVESRGVDIDHLVVGQILSSEKHPGADKLSVCQVDDGSGPDSPRQIVCGAKNYQVGDKVPVALPGCQLSPDFQIKVGQLRGVDSHGMMCSGSELGLEKESDGLLILDPSAKPGTPIRDLFGQDTIFELEITPNRPDCLSHLGVARELAALAKQPLKGVAHHGNSTTATKVAKDEEIQISAPESGPFYSGRWIRGVKVAESPAWLKERLESIGLRPINNVVDITNYVLMEMGQPLHAFDLAKLDGGIQVRLAEAGEEFLALDGETYSLEATDLVIADAKKAVAIGGVMGGEDSGVTETTTDILLEAAYFTPTAIRRTARRLNLHSDSSYRFERGVDPAQVIGASDLATKLILEIAGGTADPEIVVCGKIPAAPPAVTLDRDACRRLIGHTITDTEIDGILTGLGLINDGGDTWQIPTFRYDLERPVDLMEEVARVYGLDNVPGSTVARFLPSSKADAAYDFTRKLQTQLAGIGFHETRNLKLISGAQLEDDRATTHRGMSPIRLKNPLNDEQDYLRPGLVPGLLATAARNVRFGHADLRLFECGRVFTATPKGDAVEHEHLALLMTGTRSDRSWIDSKPGNLDLFDLRGVLENLIPGVLLVPVDGEESRLLGAVSIEAGAGKKPIKLGLAGIVPPARARDLDINAPILVAEVNLKKLDTVMTGATHFQDLPRFPATTRDVAMLVPAELPNGAIEGFLASRDETLLTGYRLFDVFTDPTGEKLAADRKSLAYSLTYRASDRTLESAEIDSAHGKILDSLKREFSIEFR
ncbi:MAG: phenylalanine--tRNA ligase subunit beta [Verrucomicrobiae bacterium]|nr:phenylalanine--tRNA ligase subunit beta [Verrucomicrobiae bacterium]